jgi:hypothetical protein
MQNQLLMQLGRMAVHTVPRVLRTSRRAAFPEKVSLLFLGGEAVVD